MNTMKAFTVSVSVEPLKEAVRVEVPRAIVYDQCNGVLKLDGTHPHFERIREIVSECVTLDAETDWDGARRDALHNELSELTSKAEAAAVQRYNSDAWTSACKERDREAAAAWLSDLAKQEKAGLELCDIPGWEKDSGVICQMFKMSYDRLKDGDNALYRALNRVYYAGFMSGKEAQA